LAMLVAPGCSGGTKAGWELYENSEHGFQISYPEDWVESTSPGSAVAFTDPDEDDFIENVNVFVESSYEYSLSDYAQAGRQSFLSVIEDGVISGEKDITVNGVDAQEWIITWSFQGIELKQRQACFVSDGKGYVITCSALPATYTTYVATFDEFISSFKLT